MADGQQCPSYGERHEHKAEPSVDSNGRGHVQTDLYSFLLRSCIHSKRTRSLQPKRKHGIVSAKQQPRAHYVFRSTGKPVIIQCVVRAEVCAGRKLEHVPILVER